MIEMVAAKDCERAASPTLSSIQRLPDACLSILVAKVIQSAPETAWALLQVNARIHGAAIKALYEELYIADDAHVLHSPEVFTRLSTVLRHPETYGALVRTCVVVPQPFAGNVLSVVGPLLDEKTATKKGSQLHPRQLGTLLSILPNLQSFVWASSRTPPSQLVPLLGHLAPQLSHLCLRPDASFHNVSIQRWNGQGLSNLDKLTTLSVSFVSAEGVRHLASALASLVHVSCLTIDSPFVSDAFLAKAGEMRKLTHLVLRCTGTKITDRGILALLENCMVLHSLDLKEMEGRLSKNVWDSLESLPDTFEHFSLLFAEEGPHHSWIADHLEGTFNLLSLASWGLRKFSITTLAPSSTYVRLNGTDGNPLPPNGMTQVKRIFLNPCDELVRPRRLPEGALGKIAKYGKRLEILELDLFELSIDETRVILETCTSLRHLRILLDAPLSKLLTMSSLFVPLDRLCTLSISLTMAYCPLPYVIQTLPEEKVQGSRDSAEVIASDSPTMPMPELSPASTHASLPLTEQEAISPTSSPRNATRTRFSRKNSLASSVQLVNTTADSSTVDHLGCINGLISSTRAPDVSIPPKREIRKLARRCPSLKAVKWYGRTGKGEWQIEHPKHGNNTTISFVPVYMLDGKEQDGMALESGADVERLIVSRRLANGGSKVLTLDNVRTEHSSQDFKTRLDSVPGALLDDLDFPMLDQNLSGSRQQSHNSQQYRRAPISPPSLSSPISFSPLLSPRSVVNRSSFATSPPYQQATSSLSELHDDEREESKRSYAAATGKQQSGSRSRGLSTSSSSEPKSVIVHPLPSMARERRATTILPLTSTANSLPPKPVFPSTRRASHSEGSLRFREQSGNM